ncbi:WD40 repeat-like protein [Trametopsis cervina]|nr:WD40 repeat-like protein [Trametopsis cervina]
MSTHLDNAALQDGKIELSDVRCEGLFLPKIGIFRRSVKQFRLEVFLDKSTESPLQSAASASSGCIWGNPIIFTILKSSSTSPTLTIKVRAKYWFKYKTIGEVTIDSNKLETNTAHKLPLTIHPRSPTLVNPSLRPSLCFSAVIHCPPDSPSVSEAQISVGLPVVNDPPAQISIALPTESSIEGCAGDPTTTVADAAVPVAHEDPPKDTSPATSSTYFSGEQLKDMSADGTGGKETMSPLEEMKDVLTESQAAMQQLSTPLTRFDKAAATVDSIDEIAGNMSNPDLPWEPVLANIKIFVDKFDGVAEIHPYAKIAWGVISAVPKLFLSQLEKDQSMRDLIEAMGDMFAFVREAEPLRDIPPHRDVIKRIILQTAESGLLIRSYVETRNFFLRTVKHIADNIQQQFEQHRSVFQSLKETMKSYATMHTAASAMRIEANSQQMVVMTSDISATTLRTLAVAESQQADLKELVNKGYLDEIYRNDTAQCIPDKRCLPGTRKAIIDDIMGWVYQSEHADAEALTHAGVCLLRGVAGSGKSTIAHEIAQLAAESRRLGASFCFDASKQSSRSPNHLFGTIAHGLADIDEGWQTALLAILKDLSSSERRTISMTSQLENFLKKPSQKLHCVGPIIIVIDALDESGDAETRKSLLRNILEMATILPTAFRILITTRPEKDIMDMLGKESFVQQMDVMSIDPDSILSDIHSFIQNELSGIADLLASALEDSNWSMQLATRSEGSFQWAATACKFIEGSGKAGQTPDERMEIILAQDGPTHEPLDDIYLRVLSSVCNFGADASPARQRFQVALGLVLAVREPLSLRAMKELLKGNRGVIQAMNAFLPFLGSLFEGVGDDNRPFRPFHTSVRDFLTTEERSKQYCVKPAREHDTLVQASLQTIADGPQFNICDLQSSYIPNRDIPDLKKKIETHISPALLYAHRFWDAHVRDCKSADAIQLAVKGFLDNSVLIWLEVTGVLGSINTVLERVSRLREWNKQQNGTIPDSIFAEVQRFVSMCSSVVSKSVPHLYLSALAFVPQASFIYEKYAKRYSRALRVVNGSDIRWPQCLLRLNAGSQVTGIAVSPDGCTIASAQGNRAHLWDAATGERIGEPLAGHSDRVRAITFSPNGRRLVSGSKDCTIKLWNTATGQPVGQPIQGHTGGVNSISCSPDGKSIVSGSDDKTVRIWDAETQCLVHTLEGHTDAVWSVACSPDGRTVASSSKDQTIRLWDLAMSSPSAITLTGHEGRVNSVAFSPDGKTVASASADRTIRLWDVATRTLIGELLTHQSKAVNSVTFSEDGTRLISSAADSSIRVWNIAERRQVGFVLTGHRGWVISTVFPSDGLKVVSGSYDWTICVWDVMTDEPVNESAVTMSGAVHSVAFSPNGRRLASGLYDGTIRQWDAATGKAIGEPLVGHSEAVWLVVFSADGRKLVSVSQDCTVRQWGIATGATIGNPLAGHSKPVLSVAISKDGRWIISGSLDGTVVRWNTATGERDGEFDVPGATEVNQVEFSPDGQTVVAALEDGTLRLWDAATTEPIGTLTGHTKAVWSVAFSADGAKLVSGSGDGTVRLWNMETKDAIGKHLSGHTDAIWTVAFSRDGTRIVSSSHDRTVRQWSVATQEQIGRPLEHTARVFSAVISPDGQQIVSGTEDGSIKAWKTSDDASFDTGASPAAQALPYTDSSRIEDGWVLGPRGELLFWVAPDYRTALRKPGNEWVIAARTLELDLSRFAHGTSWTDCRD